jgi:(1->4)-alpha-D-glucan 1-alpha-D-glucosylmutase
MDRLVRKACDGAIKLFVTHRALNFRKDHRELLSSGSYIPLLGDGSRSNNAVAFARQWKGRTVIAAVGRFFLKIRNSHPAPIGDVWNNAAILLPKKIRHTSFQDVFTGQTVTVEDREGEACLSLAKIFLHCPVALLLAENSN